MLPSSQPFLPDHTQPGGDVGLRLWAADGLGFVMAPTALPLSLLHTQPLSGQAAAAAADEHRHVPAPFIANMYIKVCVGRGGGQLTCAFEELERH